MKSTTKAPAPTVAANKKAPATKAADKSMTKERSTGASGLRDFFEDAIKDIYWAEKALTKAIPKMSKNATSEELEAALNDHLSVTEEHVQRLEQVFEMMEMKPEAKKCEAMEGLIKEGDSILEDTKAGPVRDAGIIAGCQKIEHYEIATYGTLVTYARILGEDDIVALLEQTLEEEKAADHTLTGIAVNSINLDASNESSNKNEKA